MRFRFPGALTSARTGALSLSLALPVALWPGMAGAADYMADAARLIASGELPAARLQLRNAIKADPLNAAAHFKLGFVVLQLGDAAAAEKEALTAKEEGYDPVEVRSLLSAAYIGAGRYRDLLRDFPPDEGSPELRAVTLVARGRVQMLLDHPEQAQESFEQARTLSPGTIGPLLGEAQLALSRKDLATAEQRIDAALKIDPHAPEALQRLAALRADKGDQAGALHAANDAVAAAPGQYAYRIDRAGLLVAFGKDAEARADIDAVLALSPGLARAIYYRSILLLRSGDYAGANADLDKLSTFISQSPGAYYIVALVKQKLGQNEQALDAANRYFARNPGDTRGALLLAQLQLQASRPDKAVEALTPLVEARTDNAAIYDMRGTALTRLGRLPEASSDYEKALALTPNDPALLARSGATQLALNQAGAAATLLERSVSLAPQQPQTEALLATALLDSGKVDAAQRAVEQLKAQKGDNATVDLLAGGIQLAKFDLAGARQTFEAVLRANPDSIAARTSLARVALLQQRDADWANLLNEVLKREPAREPVVNDVANAMLRQGKTADAVGVLERAHAADPGNPRFLARLAGLYISAGDAQKALALTEGTDQADQKSAGAPLATLLVRAEAQAALKQPDAAQQTYRQVLERDRGIVFARLQLLRLLVAANDAPGAQAVLQDGLLADPQNEQLLKAAVEIEARGNLDTALATAARLDRDPAHQPASGVLQGDLYFAAKRYDDALKSYGASMKRAPSTTLALRVAGAQGADGHAEQAAQGLRDWLAQHPGDVDAELALSDMDIRAARLDSARTLLSDVLAKRPNDAKVLNNLAWIEQQARDPQALVLAQRAYQLAPGAQTADTWGYILATQGAGDHGVALLRMATLQAPADMAMRYHLAVAYSAAGQPAEAAKLLTTVVAAPADFPEKAQARQLLTKLSGGK